MSRLSQITQKQRERLRENTFKMAGGAAFITYKDDGKFSMGNNDVTDTDYLAVPDRCDAVYLCFQNSTVKELARTNMMDEDNPPRPKGYDDQEKWEVKAKTKASLKTRLC